MKIQCISIRKSEPEQLKVGEVYYFDRNSVWIDSDGDAFANVYADNYLEKFVGRFKLSHFKSIM